MKRDSEVDWKEYARIRPFMDPQLRIKRNLLRAVVRMFMAGMIGFCATCTEAVRLSTVVKNYTEEGELVQRIVWDLRRTNCRFLSPPWGPLGSPAGIAALDLWAARQ